MRLARIAAIVATLAMAGSPVHAGSIDGTYRVEGKNPSQGSAYAGEAQIKQTGQTYAVIWKIGDLRQIGTGVVIDNVFSIVFQSLVPGRTASRPGIAVFQIDNDQITSGIWSTLGDDVTGQEVWTAADRP